jgi:hypothetical protein
MYVGGLCLPRGAHSGPQEFVIWLLAGPRARVRSQAKRFRPSRAEALAPAGETEKNSDPLVETSDYTAVLSGAALQAPRSAAFLCLLFRTVGTREGLPSPFFYSILADQKGNIGV